MARKFEEGYILFAHVIEDADGAEVRTGKADDLAARAAELSLQRLTSAERENENAARKVS